VSAPENPPAFPSIETHPSFDVPMHHFGMTLRDYFAGQALLGIAGYFTNLEADEMAEEATKSATASYLIADAMLTGRVRAGASDAERAELYKAERDELLLSVYQYRNDMLFPPAPDSAERRLQAVEALIAKVTGE
jgi:hypothetical protein